MRRKMRSLSFRQIIPNMITSGNILCGMLSLTASFHGQYPLAAWLILWAVFFDFMDGKMARSLGGGSAFGMELDSLADVVSFGVAPAMVMYGAYLQGFYGVTAALCCSFYAICGALRLARFNVTVSRGGFFQGLPIPGGGLFLVAFVMARVSLPPELAMFLLFGTALLLISNVPYGNLKKMKKGNADRRKVLFLLLVGLGLFAILRGSAPLALMATYVVGGFLKFDWGQWLSLPSEEGEELQI